MGYKVHLSETCDEGYPDLITQVSTTPATTSDFVMGAPIEQDLAERDLLPGTHVIDSGYVSQGTRRFDLRRSRSIGLAKTHVQQTINATAMNLVRLADWLRKGGTAQPKRRPGHFARLAPPGLFGLAACEASTTLS